jgi:hypothetical protein
MTTEISINDQKWINALKPFWGGGTVPFWRDEDGSIDAQKTIDWLMRARGQKKIGKMGESLEWPEP